MDIEVKTNRIDDVMTFMVSGRLDSYTSPTLLATVKNEIADAEQAVFDFQDLEYISSAGVRVVASTIKLLGMDNVSIINANEEVEAVFALVGMNGVIA